MTFPEIDPSDPVENGVAEPDAGRPLWTTEEIIADVIDACVVEDYPRLLGHLSEDCIYLLHVEETILPMFGEQQGKAAIRATLETWHTSFESILYRPLPISIDGNIARHRVEYIYRHRESGQNYTGTLRLVWTIENGRVVRCEEFHDQAKFAAFMRLVGQDPNGG